MLDKFDNVLGSVHFPKDVLDDGMILKHGQHFKIVLVLSKQLLPESQTVDPLALHRVFNRFFFALIAETRGVILTLYQASSHEEPLKGLYAHKRVIIEHG